MISVPKVVSDETIRNRLLIVFGTTCSFFIASWMILYSWQVQDLGIRTAFSLEINYFHKESMVAGEADMPEQGDFILAMDGEPIRSWPQWMRTVLGISKKETADNGGPHLAKIVTVQLFRPVENRTFETRLQFGQTSFTAFLPSFVWFFLKMGMVLVGALVFWWRTKEGGARQFFVLGLVSLVAYMGGFHWWRIASQPLLLFSFLTAALLLPAVSLHFFLIFPRPKVILLRNPPMVLGIVYAPSVLFLLLLFSGYLRLRVFYGVDAISSEGMNLVLREMLWEIYVFLGLAAGWFLACIGMLIHSFWRAADDTEKNQVKWILLGCVAAILPIFYSLYLVLLDPGRFSQGGATWPMFAASCFVTAAFTISITRYKLLQLEQFLTSGVSYFFLSTLAGLIYYGLVFLGMLLAGAQFSERPSFFQVAAVSGTALMMIFILDRLSGRLRTVLDRRFYKEKNKLDTAFKKMSQAIENLVDTSLMARRFLMSISETLGFSSGAVFLKAQEIGGFKLANYIGEIPRQDLLFEDNPLVQNLLRGDTIGEGLSGISSKSPAIRQLKILGGILAVPMHHEGNMLGFFLLGPRLAGPYSIDEIHQMVGISQIAVLGLLSAEGHRTIDVLNRELKEKVEKIAEQQNRILALQAQLSRRPAYASETENVQAIKSGGEGAPPPTGDLLKNQSLFGSSPRIQELLELVGKVAPSTSAVLLRGESGTGKEVVAQLIHENSSRAVKPFVKVHCGALSPGILESELFGHVKGAFTSAIKDKIGRFELANGGTLFLDEIGDITPEVQIKLLRVLQEKIIERVGSNQPIPVDVRIIAATHQDLENLIAQGKFRGDLYYRLNVFPINLPPLRDRQDDVVELAHHFMGKFAAKFSKGPLQLEDDAILCLKNYSWPGNIRELENVIERATVVANTGLITLNDLPTQISTPSGEKPTGVVAMPIGIEGNNFLEITRNEFEKKEKDKILNALTHAGGNRSKAARALGVPRSTLVSKMRKIGIE